MNRKPNQTDKNQEADEAKQARKREEQKKEDEKRNQPACDNCGKQGHTIDSCTAPPNPGRPPRRK